MTTPNSAKKHRKTSGFPRVTKEVTTAIAISKDTVEYVANLARIELSAKELDELSRQLADILGFIDKLKTIDIKGIAPTSHILPINNVLREDSPRESLSSDKALENAPQKQGSFFVVPKVIE